MQCALQKFSHIGHPRFASALLNPPAVSPPPLGEEWARPGSPFPSALEVELRRCADAPDAHLDPELRVDASLQDFAAMVLQSCHEQSDRYVPRCGEVVCPAGGADEREQIVLWLLQVGQARMLADETIFAAVQLFDRYCVRLKGEPVPQDSLHRVVTAILSIAIKVTGHPDEANRIFKHRELLADLGRGQFSVEEVFAEETAVLRKLSFNLSVPTSVDFLLTFLLPFSSRGQQEVPSPVTCLAKFLLQLSLTDVALQYKYPQAVLAAGAVYVALWCTRAQPGRVAGLLGDLGCSMARSSQHDQFVR